MTLRSISNVTTTWTDSGTVYTGVGVNVYAISYSSTSRPFDVRVNGGSIFSVDTSGTIRGNTVNVLFNTANAAYNFANNLAVASGDPSFAFRHANAAFGVTNAAFTKANTALQNTSGTFAGTLAVAGNISATGANNWFLPMTNVINNGVAGISWYQTTPTSYGIYRSSGDWSAPNYQQLYMTFDTGIVINGGTAFGKSGIVLQPNGGNVGIGTASPTGRLDVASRGITTGSMPAGSILQVVQTAKTSTTSIAVGGNSWNEFDSAFRVTITPTLSSSKILLTACITGAQNTGTVRYKFQFSTDGGTNFSDVTPIGDAVGSRSRGHFGYAVNGDTNQFNTCSMELLHSPATTSSIVYRIQFGQDVSTTYHFNRSISYSDNFLGGTMTSTFVAKEIAV